MRSLKRRGSGVERAGPGQKAKGKRPRAKAGARSGEGGEKGESDGNARLKHEELKDQIDYIIIIRCYIFLYS